MRKFFYKILIFSVSMLFISSCGSDTAGNNGKDDSDTKTSASEIRDQESGTIDYGGDTSAGEIDRQGEKEEAQDIDECPDLCSEGEQECLSGKVKVCERDLSGCFKWGDPLNCEDGFCMDNKYCGVCKHKCETIGSSCEGNTLFACTEDNNGCRVLSEEICEIDCSSEKCIECIVGENRYSECKEDPLKTEKQYCSEDGSWLKEGDCFLGGTLNLQIEKVTLNQGVQVDLTEGPDATSAAPYNAITVAGRKGVFRVFLRHENPNGNQTVTARLHGVRNGMVFETLTASGTLSPEWNENYYNSSINFDLPIEWMTVGTEFFAEINGDRAIFETDYSDNRFPAEGFQSFMLRETPPMKIVIVPVKLTDKSAPDTSDSSIEYLVNSIRKLYPIPDNGLDMNSSLDITIHDIHESELSDSDFNSFAAWSTLLNEITTIQNSENSDYGTYYYGWFNRTAYGIAGLGNMGYVKSSIGSNTSHKSSTMAHEIGHNHNLPHVECAGNEGAPLDSAYPYDGGKIGRPGFDVISSYPMLIPSTSYADIMSYCSTQWISDHNWNKLYKSDNPYMNYYSPKLITVRNGLKISGIIGEDDNVSITSFHSFPDISVSEDHFGDHEILFINEGKVVGSYPFTPNEVSLGSSKHFSISVPFSGKYDSVEVRNSTKTFLTMDKSSLLDKDDINVERDGAKITVTTSSSYIVKAKRAIIVTKEDGSRTVKQIGSARKKFSFISESFPITVGISLSLGVETVSKTVTLN